MKVTRTSGLPIEPEDIPKYQKELVDGVEEIKKKFGPFEKLTQKTKSEFGKAFDELRLTVKEKYVCEVDWDFETVIKSKTKLKELTNRYGVIAFSRGSEDKRLQCFIIDSKI